VTRLDVLYRLLKELIQGKLHLKEGGREGRVSDVARLDVLYGLLTEFV